MHRNAYVPRFGAPRRKPALAYWWDLEDRRVRWLTRILTVWTALALSPLLADLRNWRPIAAVLLPLYVLVMTVVAVVALVQQFGPE